MQVDFTVRAKYFGVGIPGFFPYLPEKFMNFRRLTSLLYSILWLHNEILRTYKSLICLYVLYTLFDSHPLTPILPLKFQVFCRYEEGLLLFSLKSIGRILGITSTKRVSVLLQAFYVLSSTSAGVIFAIRHFDVDKINTIRVTDLKIARLVPTLKELL